MLRKLSLLLLCLVTTGCSSWSPQPADTGIAPTSVQVERGRPNALIDGAGWVLGIPNKLALWDKRADNHDISPETEIQLVNYLEQNNLNSVMVRVNQYDPIGEWHRLIKNKKIHGGWRYTAGTYNMLKYTFLPGRLLGGDWYNPFTDTINLSSDIPAIALTGGAYAKDIHQREKPGPYASSQELPIVGIWHENASNKEALEYVRATGTPEQKEEAYRILYPNNGGSWGAQIASFVPYGNVAGRLVGAAVGHAANGVRKITNDEPNPESLDAPTATAPQVAGEKASKEWLFR